MLTDMPEEIAFVGRVEKFPGADGWYYVPVPVEHTAMLKERRRAWGMYPVEATVGATTWNTKLMTKKGGDFFVALKASVRRKEGVTHGDTASITIRLL